jgi:hypothetical protein
MGLSGGEKTYFNVDTGKSFANGSSRFIGSQDTFAGRRDGASRGDEFSSVILRHGCVS